MIDEGQIDNNFQVLQDIDTGIQPHWLKDIVVIAQKIGLNISQTLTKPLIKRKLHSHYIDTLKDQMLIARQKTLKYFDNDIETSDCKYNSWYQLHWLRLRVEGIFLYHRRGHDRRSRLTPEQQKLCPVCKSECETVDHFLICPKYRHKHIWFETKEPQWLLSVPRDTGERNIISQAIKDRIIERDLIITEKT